MTARSCGRPACAGFIDEGYCNACGLAEGKASPPPPAPSAAAPTHRHAAVISAASVLSQGTAPAVYSRAAGGSRRSRPAGRRSGRKPLGAGLVSLPELPSINPEHAVLADAKVPERKRFCSRCEAALRRETGFCGKCGARYSFVPSLRRGDVVADQYEVKGPLAFGGLGWVYLAFDKLLSRYVVLKGLLNAQDTSAAAAAVAERQFLAAVKHPNIVAIYSFVEAAGEGFIVMEYVGGRTLKQIRQEHGPLRPAEAIAYIHRILDAFGYLHRHGLVFCDFKPDNVMLENEDVKLIDLGGVRRQDDPHGDIYGTVGYSAPEAGEGPTPASDLFTVGRTLAVLLAEIPGFGKEHRFTLPGPEDKPLFGEQQSLYRFLLKATAARADDRFATAEEMSDQLLGVLREVVALEVGQPKPGPSHAFGADLLNLEPGDVLEEVGPGPQLLPRPLVDVDDPAAQAVQSALQLPDPGRRLSALRTVRQQCPPSREARLRLAAALIDAGGLSEAEFLLHDLAGEDLWDWRVPWFQGMLQLRRTDSAAACRLFDQVYFDLPGELAPKLALALAAELAGDLALASRLYALVSEVDPAFVSAVFGLARCAQRAGDRNGAVAALERLHPSSSLFVRGRVAALRALLVDAPHPPERRHIVAAAAILESLSLDERDAALLTQRVYEAAVAEVATQRGPVEKTATLLGQPMAERPLRLGLESLLRQRARLAGADERIDLVDAANRVRPRTLL